MTLLKPDKGLLLIAKPSIIGDVSFNRSVILLAEHTTENGSVGFILNKPLEYTLNDFIPEVNSKLRVYNGGPVEQDNLYFIHKIPDLIPGSIEISQGIYWGGDFKAPPYRVPAAAGRGLRSRVFPAHRPAPQLQVHAPA